MKSWVRRMGVLAASLTMAGGAVTTPATAAEVLAWECPDGFSCYYDGRIGTNLIFVAPSPGCHTLATTVANRISSVYNLGPRNVHLYDRSPCTGDKLFTIPPGGKVGLISGDNQTNSIKVDP